MDDDLPFSREQIAYGSLSTSAPLAYTPPAAISALFELLSLTPTDVFIDLGCGSANVLIAAQKSGCRVIGYEKDASLVEEARGNLLAAGIKDGDGPGQSRIFQADLERAELNEATLVFCYLVPRQQAAIKTLLEDFLSQTGKRVATYEYPLEGAGWPVPKIDPRYKIYVYSSLEAGT